jgi:hypothetical protein
MSTAITRQASGTSQASAGAKRSESPSRALPLPRPVALGAGVARTGMVLVLAAAVAGGFLVTRADASSLAVARAGVDLTRLLRAMALLKSLLALGAVGALLWRLGESVSLPRFALYAVAAGAMVAGPGVIWGMVYVRTGAALLHGGLLATAVVLWRDPAVSERFARLLSKRRVTPRASETSRSPETSSLSG